MSNIPRFRRVERCLQRHVRSGELWFVGRLGGRIVWHRLRTHDLRVARASVAMLGSSTNGNSAIFLVVDGKEQPIDNKTAPQAPPKSLPRVRQVLEHVDDAESPASPKTEAATRPATPPSARAFPVTTSGSVPTLDELLVRWRRGKAGLKTGTEDKLDSHLKMLRRYVETQRPVTDYKSQDIRDYLAKARADKDNKSHRRLKGQTINEAVWRPLNDAFALALEEGVIPRNPMASVKREKTEPIVRNQHKWAESEQILEEVKKRSRESYLELKFMLFMGVGQAEAKDFTEGSVDWQGNEIRFIRRKTSKQFRVPLYPWAKDFIRAELEPRLQQGKPVFEWRNPRKALETACQRLGFARVDIRSLRRTLVVHLIEQRVDIRLIAKWQGHNDARLILSHYGAHIDAGYEKEAMALLGEAPLRK